MQQDKPDKIEDSPLTESVEAMEMLIAQQAWQEAAGYMSEDILYKVGGRSPVYGVGGIREYMNWQNALVHWDGHDIRMKFSRGNTVVIEVDSKFTRLADNVQLVVPCTDIYTFRDGRIADWRVYADTSVFSA
ncbi:MAG: nuclear transport factor 2 family protein [Pseudomonadota bacterium]